MFGFRIRNVLWLMVMVGLACGCGRAKQKARIIDEGIAEVTKHAAAIDEAAKGDNRPAQED
jgi:hypothetical protein